MRLVSPLLKHAVYPLLAGVGHFQRRARRGRFCVLTYHGVLPEGYRSTDRFLDGNLVGAESFRRQLHWLKRHVHVVSPEDVRAWLERGKELPGCAVLLTCDDGLRNTLTDMLPILREEGLQCLFFVTGASADQTTEMLWYEELYLLLVNAKAERLSLKALEIETMLGDLPQRRARWWELVRMLSQRSAQERKSFLESARSQLYDRQNMQNQSGWLRRFQLLTRSELQQLAAAGMTIGAHTLTHPLLPEQPEKFALEEMEGSRQALESVLESPIWAFAYTFGDAASVTAREIALAERAGFQCAFVNFGGGFGASLPRFALPRVHVTGEMELAEFAAHVSGFYQMLHKGRSAGLPLPEVNGLRAAP